VFNQAARSGDIAELQRLVAEGHSMDVTDVHGSNALLWAAGSGHLDVCRLLVDQLRMNPHTCVCLCVADWPSLLL
jgi:ankyrin repeat protein